MHVFLIVDRMPYVLILFVQQNVCNNFRAFLRYQVIKRVSQARGRDQSVSCCCKIIDIDPVVNIKEAFNVDKVILVSRFFHIFPRRAFGITDDIAAFVFSVFIPFKIRLHENRHKCAVREYGIFQRYVCRESSVC